MSQNQYANSNIMSLTGTLVIRLISGPLCDKFGPRYVFVGCLLAGAIPTALAGTVTTPTGLIVLRFFIGVLGASFVPCQVWCTGFFDKNVVGTANALAGGWGNSGGGITVSLLQPPYIIFTDPNQYFVMPAIFDSLMKHQHLTAHVAWRVSFIVPFIIIVSIAMGILFTTEDCPSGKWANRHQPLDNIVAETIDASSQEKIPTEKSEKDAEAAEHEPTVIDKAEGEVIVAPTLKEGLQVFFSLQTLALAAPYACSFGTYSPSQYFAKRKLTHISRW